MRLASDSGQINHRSVTNTPYLGRVKMKRLSLTFFTLLTLLVSLVSSGLFPAPAVAQVEMPAIAATLFPGENVTAVKNVFIPPLPQVIDIFLLEDETGSFFNDIFTLKALAPQIWDAVPAFAR